MSDEFPKNKKNEILSIIKTFQTDEPMIDFFSIIKKKKEKYTKYIIIETKKNKLSPISKSSHDVDYYRNQTVGEKSINIFQKIKYIL